MNGKFLVDRFALSHLIHVYHVEGLKNYIGKDFKKDAVIEVCSDNGKIHAVCFENIVISDSMCRELSLILYDVPRLDFYKVSFESAPSWLKGIAKLEHLAFVDLPDVDYNSYEFVQEIQSLRNLRITNDLEMVPDWLCNIKQLTYLDLRHNKIQRLPDSLGNLQQLTYLDLRSNLLQRLPDSLANLQQLTSLKLSENVFLSLQNSLGKLRQLTLLDLGKNKLQRLPDSIGNLHQLTTLKLSGNALLSLPDFIGNLRELTYLELEDNKLQSLSDSLANLQQLTFLRLSGNELLSLPDFIGNLRQLILLDLGKNKLQRLPDSIGDLHQLNSLDLSNNKLQSVPDSIGNLQKLTNLKVDSNELQSLPDSIGNLHQLKYLILFRNQLSKLPDSIGNLQQLNLLVLFSNQLQNLPDSLCNLEKLNYLDLSSNKLQRLPDFTGNLQQLTTLDLENNKLKNLPDSMCGLHSLSTFNISNNDLYFLPDWISKLESLKRLVLEGSHLSMLAGSLLDLNVPYIFSSYFFRTVGKEGIFLENVKLDKMDISLFSQSRQTIEAFYAEGLVETHECKVIFLGKGDAGKTSIIKRIKNEGFTLEKTTTKGISITDWLPFDDCAGKVNIWDFGGQIELDIAHKCFMTPRSVYVVVFSAIENSTIDREAVRWLDTISTFAEDSPVILVINKIDKYQNSSLNERALIEKYPNIVLPVIRTSACTNEGLPALAEAICESVRNSVSYNSLFNRKWLIIKRALESNTSKYIGDTEFEAICNNAGVSSQYLHQLILDWFRVLGVSFYYKDGNRCDMLKDKYYVLNPNWLVNGMYRLITHSKDGNPFVSHDEIFKLMQTPQVDDVEPGIIYSKEETRFVLDVARYFEISYETNNSGIFHEFLPMKSRKDEIDSNLAIVQNLHIRWTSDYIPLILAYRLMVRRFVDLEQDKVWRYGAYFTDITNSSTRAKISINLAETQLDLFVASSEYGAEQFLYVLRNEIMQLLSKIGIDPKETFIIQKDGKSGEIDFSDLIYYLRENKHFDIPGFARNLDAGEILGLYFPCGFVEQYRKSNEFTKGDVNMNFENIDTLIITDSFKDSHDEGEVIIKRDESKREVAIAPNCNISINKWPNSITAQQFAELKRTLDEFLNSNEVDEMKQGDVKRIKAILKEPYQTGWQKFKDFLSASADVITITSAISLFITNHGVDVAGWIKNLF